jgi:LacI family transcriptional regulator
MSVTMKDIARDVGVSVVTVSKALRNRADIGEETRKRIVASARRLRYRPNLTARSLVTGRSQLIGMVVPDLLHPFFAEVGKSLSKELRGHGYYLIITASEEDAELEAREIDQLLARQLDALVIASTSTGTREFRQIEEQKVPYVLIDRAIAGLAANFVGIDDRSMGFMATEHLIDVGCRRIAHIAAAKTTPNRLREEGYRAALEKNRLKIVPEYTVYGETVDVASREQGFQAMQNLLGLKTPPDGVFCYNDPMALGAIDCILRTGLRVPEDVAVIGCGNLHYDELLRVPLSSMDQKTDQIGKRTAQLLLKLIGRKAKGRPERIILESELVRRQSTQRSATSRASGSIVANPKSKRPRKDL